MRVSLTRRCEVRRSGIYLCTIGEWRGSSNGKKTEISKPLRLGPRECEEQSFGPSIRDRMAPTGENTQSQIVNPTPNSIYFRDERRISLLQSYARDIEDTFLFFKPRSNFVESFPLTTPDIVGQSHLSPFRKSPSPAVGGERTGVKCLENA